MAVTPLPVQGPSSSDEHTDLAAISAELVRVYKQQIGRGPTKTRTFWAGPDTIVVILERTLTVAELTMRGLDEHERLRDLRTLLQADSRNDLCDPIERITGRSVRAFIGGIDIEADVATQIFVLQPNPGATTSAHASRRPA
jgi:uncharacterized protein YbcI